MQKNIKKIIVTGGTGFIGYHLANCLLNCGFDEIHILSSKKIIQTQKEDHQIFYHKCNLLNYSETQDVVKHICASHMIHFAWDVTHGLFWTSDSNFLWVKASVNLLKSFYNSGGKSFIGAGTYCEYDLDKTFLKEYETPYLPSTIYGKCKREWREFLFSYSNDNNISVAWGHIFNLYGEHENKNRLIPYIINSLLTKQKITCLSGDIWRDYSYSMDIANGFAKLASSNEGGIFNFTTNSPIQIKDLIYFIAAQLDIDSFSVEFLQTDKHKKKLITGDITRASKILNWKPHSLKYGLDNTIKWWKQRVSLARNTGPIE